MTRLDSIGLDYVPPTPKHETLLSSVVTKSLFIANRLIDEFIGGSENIVHMKRHELDVIEYIHDNSCVC